MTAIDVPFNKPALLGRELEYVAQAVASGHLSGNGPFTRKVRTLLEQELGAERVTLTPSCTHALEMAAILLDIAPGDEVILPSFTFVSSANPFVLRGARPVFVDVREDTLNLDERLLEPAIGPRTRAVVAVHYAGVACEMDTVLEVARRRGIAVVEDNAHGLFATYRGRALGTFGALGAQSFHQTKVFTCGEGGALLVNDPALRERAEIVQDKGTDRARFARGESDRYAWVDLGSSWFPSEIQAAFLLAQLEERVRVQERRRHLWTRYAEELRTWAEQREVFLATVPPECGPSYHIFWMLLPSRERVHALKEHLAGRGILAVCHYAPLHLSPMGQKFGARQGDCPVAEAVSDQLLRLPLFNVLTDEEQGRVIDAVRAFE